MWFYDTFDVREWLLYVVRLHLISSDMSGSRADLLISLSPPFHPYASPLQMQTQAAAHGRGVTMGRVYREDGTLVAVVVS